MHISEKDFLSISNKLLESADRDGIKRNVVRLILKQDNAILILKRAKSDHLPDMYELPGGGLNTNEDLFSAAKRELFEETGLSIKEFISISDIFDFNANSDNKKCRGYVFNINTDTKNIILNPNEHSEYKWVSFNEIDNLNMLSNIKNIVKKIQIN